MLHFQAPAPQISEGPALPYTAVYLSYSVTSPLFDYESATAMLALASSHILPICGRRGFCPITLLKSFLKGHLFIRSTARLSVLSLSSAAFSTVYFLLKGHHLRSEHPLFFCPLGLGSSVCVRSLMSAHLSLNLASAGNRQVYSFDLDLSLFLRAPGCLPAV